MQERTLKMHQLKVYVPEPVYVRLQLESFDPLREKTRYGSLSNLITSLLQEHFKRQDERRENESV